MTQRRFGEFVKKEAQTIANWEKSNTVDGVADFLVRHIYKQTKGDRTGYVEMVDYLNDLDREEHFELKFEESKRRWTKAV